LDRRSPELLQGSVSNADRWWSSWMQRPCRMGIRVSCCQGSSSRFRRLPTAVFEDAPCLEQRGVATWRKVTQGRGPSGDEDGSSNAQARSFRPFARRSGLARGCSTGRQRPLGARGASLRSLGLAALRRRSYTQRRGEMWNGVSAREEAKEDFSSSSGTGG
jgi:hypothetical protein